MECAQFAPSARNQQPWHFILITDREKLNTIAEENSSTGMLKAAPMAILVCADTKISPIFWQDDCGAATQNILLSAYELGLGTCWCAAHGTEKIEELFARVCGLPQHIKPFSCIALGYPLESPAMPNRFNSGKVHQNSF